MIFAEGDDVRVLRAAVAYQRNGLGKALVVGREADVKEKLESAGLGDAVRELQVVNAANTTHLESYKAFLYDRLQRKGYDRHDVHRLAARDRHAFSALMLAPWAWRCAGDRGDAEIGACAGTDRQGLRRLGAGRGGRDHRAPAQGSNSRSSSFCFEVRLTGVSTASSMNMSPMPPPRRAGMPLPRRRICRPDWLSLRGIFTRPAAIDRRHLDVAAQGGVTVIDTGTRQ
jgi:hypothetical protein